MPPIEALECFVAASRLLNFARAARTVHLSPAAFGQRIRQLEDYIGLSLFARSTRRMQLTDAGRRLVVEASAVLDAVAGLPALAHDQELIVPRSITLGTRHELGLSWLTPQIPRLEQAVPGLTVHLHFGGGDDLMRLVQDGKIDAAICSVRLADRRFAFELLHKEHYQLVASPKLMARCRINNVDALLEQTLIDAHPSLPLARYWLDADDERASLQFRELRYLGTIGAIREFVLRGRGIAVLPRYFVERDIERGRLQVVLPKKKLLTDSFRLLYARNNRQAGVFGRLAGLMRQAPLR